MYFPKEDFVRKTPHEMGISEKAISDALAHIAASHKDIHSMLILRDGALVFEHYFDPYTAADAHAMYSCSKTFTSMCVGIAAGKGLLKLTDRVADFFPEIKMDNTDYARQMTIRDLLCMASGHGEDTFPNMLGGSKSWPEVFLNQVVDHEPGSHFVYNTGATYMCSAILQKITGRTALDLADEWIFRKIGIDRPVWLTCPEGVSQGGTGLFLKPRDMARMGLLISNNGVWEGEQIIPADYIAEASRMQIDNSVSGNPGPNWTVGYGYQMWRCSFGAFRADGMGGQFIVMLPEKQLVVVFTSGLGSDIGYDLDVIRDDLLPGVSDGPIAEEALILPAEKQLDEKYLPEMGATYVFEENKAGLKSLCMDEEMIHVQMNGFDFHVPYGIGRAKISNTGYRMMGWQPARPVATTVWSEDRLFVRINEFCEPATIRLEITMEGDVMRLCGGFTMGENEFETVGKRQ